jgi:hypothetical protein
MTMCPWTVPLDPRLELWDVAYGYSAESRSRSGGTDGKGTWGGESVLIEGCEQDWKQLPQPDLPLTVELDGGFVHSSERSSRTDGWFEEITGQSMTGKGAAKCFAFVNTYESTSSRSHRRWVPMQ